MSIFGFFSGTFFTTHWFDVHVCLDFLYQRKIHIYFIPKSCPLSPHSHTSPLLSIPLLSQSIMTQARPLRNGIDVLIGTPSQIMDHMDRGTLNLSDCNIVVLDEADEMLNMRFADDVEVILDGIGSNNEEQTQCLLFSATTPRWVKDIGRNHQSSDVISIDATTDHAARTATTVRHMAIQVPPGSDSKKAILTAVDLQEDRSKYPT